MGDLIDREEALKEIYNRYSSAYEWCLENSILGKEMTMALTSYAVCHAAIKRTPSAEPKKGKWIKTGNKMEKEPRKIWWFQCSECGFRLTSSIDRTVFNYCPCCGVKMEVTK